MFTMAHAKLDVCLLWRAVTLILFFGFLNIAIAQDVRLVNGPTSYSGRVEILHVGAWGTISSEGWDSRDARVVCRQLGYADGKPAHHAAFGQGSDNIWLTEVSCDGAEARIRDCRHFGSWGIGWASHSDDAGVVCVTDDAAVNGSETAEVTLRLGSGGSTPTTGRVEIQYLGVWGTVCHNQWGAEDARVACRQLGYCEGSPIKGDPGYFTPTSGPVWLDRVACEGHEPQLAACPHQDWGDNFCPHDFDVGVVCALCPTGEVRLVGGPTNSSGRLEVSQHGVWGTVCSEGWHDADARVACRQLGFKDGRVTDLAPYGDGSGAIWLSDVACNGSEARLDNCAHQGAWGETDCRHYQDVAVQCTMVEPLKPTTKPKDTTTTSTVSMTPSSTVTLRVTTSVDAGDADSEGNVFHLVALVAGFIVLVTLVVAVTVAVIKVKAARARSRSSPTIVTGPQQNTYVSTTWEGCANPRYQLELRPMTVQLPEKQSHDRGQYPEMSDDDEIYEEISEIDETEGACNKKGPRRFTRPSINPYTDDPVAVGAAGGASVAVANRPLPVPVPEFRAAPQRNGDVAASARDADPLLLSKNNNEREAAIDEGVSPRVVKPTTPEDEYLLPTVSEPRT